jgi:hypothetical protein
VTVCPGTPLRSRRRRGRRPDRHRGRRPDRHREGNRDGRRGQGTATWPGDVGQRLRPPVSPGRAGVLLRRGMPWRTNRPGSGGRRRQHPLCLPNDHLQRDTDIVITMSREVIIRAHDGSISGNSVRRRWPSGRRSAPDPTPARTAAHN